MPYPDILAPVCTKEQYDNVVIAVVKVIHEEGYHHNRGCCRHNCQVACGAVCGPILRSGVCNCCICLGTCIGTCLCCCCLACYASKQVAKFKDMVEHTERALEKAKAQVESITSSWPTKVKLEWISAPETFQELANEVAVDQFGKTLEDDSGKAMWAPWGLNLVFVMPDEVDLASKWPPSPVQAEMIGNKH